MAHLTDLPPELFEIVFFSFMEVADLAQVYRARAVCRTFASAIDQQLLTMTPYAAFQSYYESARPRLASSRNGDGPYKFLNANLEPLLLSHAKKPMGFGTSTVFLNDIAQELLALVPIADRSNELHDQYKQDLCRALIGTTETKRFQSNDPVLTKANLPKWYTPSTAESTRLSTRDMWQKEKHNDLLAAAAAVGSERAVANYVALGGEILRTQRCFRSPLAAAASTGKLDTVRFLLETITQDVVKAVPTLTHISRGEPFSDCHRYYWIFAAAIRHAVRYGHAEIALFLLTFTRQIFPQILSEEDGPFFVEAMRTSSSLDLVKTLLEAECLANQLTEARKIVSANEYAKEGIPAVTEEASLFHVDMVSSTFQEYILEGAQAACVAGRVDVIQYLLENDFIQWTTIFHDKVFGTKLSCVQVAARYGHRSMMELYIAHGNTITSRELTIAISRNALDGQPEVGFHMAQYLLRAGALVDDLVLQECEARTSYVQRAIYKRGSIHCCITDGAMTATLIAHAAMKQSTQTTLQRYVAIKMLLRIIVSGKVRVPTEPLPFQAMAKEVIDWLKSLPVE